MYKCLCGVFVCLCVVVWFIFTVVYVCVHVYVWYILEICVFLVSLVHLFLQHTTCDAKCCFFVFGL